MSNGSLLPAVDLLLRGGVCVLMLLLAMLLVRDHARIVAARLGALFALGVAAYALCSSAALHAHLGIWAVPVLAAATGNNLVFWLFARALFDDAFHPRWWHAGAWFLVSG